jgi:GNAT superfamily N-acetyltransferase
MTRTGTARAAPDGTVIVTTRYLEMRSRRALRPQRSDRDDVSIVRVTHPWPALNRFFYTAVGGDHYWTDRLPWPARQWIDYLSRSGVETWIMSVGGMPAGYFELVRDGQDVEIAYFGLIDRFAGQGLGAHLLTTAVEKAWDTGAERVWLHTCTLDHPAALHNYLARGFSEYRSETSERTLAHSPHGPWPGAHGEQP